MSIEEAASNSEAASTEELLEQIAPFQPEEPITQPALGLVGWLRWAWRQLISMRTALLLLFLLALGAVPGSMLPQRRESSGRVEDYLDAHSTVGPWLDRLGLFDVYSSPWFSAIYLLLFISLVGCVLPRAKLHWRAIRSGPPRAPRRLERLPHHALVEFPPDVARDDVVQAARTALRRKRYRVMVDLPDGAVSAERGYLAETGNLVFHLALLGVLVSFAWSSLASYSGQVIVVQGSSFANVQPQYDEFRAGPLVDPGSLEPFSVTLEDFKVEFETQAGGNQTGAPREFDATFSVQTEPGAPSRTQTIRPNHPLDVNGTRVFLVGNGYAPKVTITDGDGHVAYRGPVVTRPLDGNYRSAVVIKVPDATPQQLGFQGVFTPSYALADGLPISTFPQPLNPKLVLRALVGRPGKDDLGVNSGAPQSVFRITGKNMTQLNTADGEPLTMLIGPGATATLPNGVGTITFDGLTRFVALDIRHDPSRIWALLTSMLALVGVTASLFVQRRRLFVRVARRDGQLVAEVGGLARGESDTVGQDVIEVAEALRTNQSLRNSSGTSTAPPTKK